jgi:hypothetical protein
MYVDQFQALKKRILIFHPTRHLHPYQFIPTNLSSSQLRNQHHNRYLGPFGTCLFLDVIWNYVVPSASRSHDHEPITSEIDQTLVEGAPKHHKRRRRTIDPCPFPKMEMDEFPWPRVR